MSRIIPGIIEVFEKEEVAESSTPGPVEIKRYWNDIVVEADRIDELLARISARLRKMRKWVYKGMVKADEVEQAEDWASIRQQVLALILRRGLSGCFLENTFVDGEGI